MKSSQKQNILRHLLYGPLCGQEQDWSLGRRIPARIHELRGKGFPIEKRHCHQGHEHQSTQWEFYLLTRATWNDCCAYCGPSGDLVHTGAESHTIDGRTWLAVKCSECGKGDWR